MYHIRSVGTSGCGFYDTTACRSSKTIFRDLKYETFVGCYVGHWIQHIDLF